MTLSQWCTNQLRPSQPFIWLLIVRMIRVGAQHWYSWRGVDPAVSFSWGGRTLSLPFSHALPLYKAFTPLYDEPLRYWVRRLQRGTSSPLRVINVGANVGDTYALLCETVPIKVLAIEGDPQYLPFLRRVMKNDPHSVCAETFIGDGESAKHELISTYGTTRLQTTSARKSDQKHSPLPSLDQLLQTPRYQDWRAADWLVLDTDGFDWSILRGAETLLSSHPWIFFEYYPLLLQQHGDEPALLWNWLFQHGYHTVWLYRNTGEYVGRFSLRTDQEFLRQLPAFLTSRRDWPYLDVMAL